MPLPFLGPMPDPSGAARLRASTSPTNMSQFGDILAGLSAGNQNAGQAATSEGLQEHLTSAFDGGPALRALRAAADESRLQHTQGEVAEQADLESGRPGRIASLETGLENNVADQNSERSFGRQTLPFALQANDRTTAAKSALANAQYVLPAQLKAQGDVAAAHETAQGNVAVENTKAGTLPLRGLMDALQAFVAKNGHFPTADEVASIPGLQGVIK